ncbi:acyl carrier protein [Streptomyces bobili]|uniref:acyl carrier protein n=1 Tax=Streptomyces bobili TaxID=67280 RepID=UPI00342C5FFC
MRAAVGAVASWLLDQLAAELRFDRVKLAGDVPVHDYGMDSIMVTQLVQTVARRLDVSVDPSALLEHPTVDGFAAYLGGEHPTELLAEFGGSAHEAEARPESEAPAPPQSSAPASVRAFGASCGAGTARSPSWTTRPGARFSTGTWAARPPRLPRKAAPPSNNWRLCSAATSPAVSASL